MIAWTIGLSAFVAGAALTWALRAWAMRRQLLDIPNERSSHQKPVPRMGGLAIVAVVGAGCLAAAGLGVLPRLTLTAILPPALLIAAVGYIDDRKGLRPSIRLLAQTIGVAWLLWCYGGLPATGIAWIDALPGVRNGLGLLALVWFINLFNFMDGIDGIAGTEAVFVAVLAGVLARVAGAETDALALLLIGACAGFLVWNWPRASIFMGDAGSGFLGFMLGALVVDLCARLGVPVLVFAIGAGFFIVDATTTVVRRFARGERVHVSHRSHAYQHLAIRWASHQRVVLLVLAINLLWLFPWALYAAVHPTRAWWCLAVALAPLLVFVLRAGAGRR